MKYIIAYYCTSDHERPASKNAIPYCFEKLEERVNQWISKGYRPLGSCTITTESYEKEYPGDSSERFLKYTAAQPMILEN